MDTVTVSSRYQIVIPTKIREALGIQLGQKVQVIARKDRIELIPLEPIQSLRGFLVGMNTEIEREPNRV